MTHFWAKTDSDGDPGLSVRDHMVNVGCVALALAEIHRELVLGLRLDPSQAAFLAAIHDVGKISPGFQRKCARWLDQNNLERDDRNNRWKETLEPDHTRVSHYAIQKYLNELSVNRKTAKFVSCVLGGHHGRMHPPADRQFVPAKLAGVAEGGIDWEQHRLEEMVAVQKLLLSAGDSTFPLLDGESPVLWWLAGLTTLADWIGSDEHFFPPQKNQPGDFLWRSETARRTVNAIGFGLPGIRPGLEFQQLFGFPPNDLQKQAMACITGPGVFVIEAPMGMGKTEAALGAAYSLLQRGLASGIYFALPTQVTSNRIHLRMQSFLDNISEDAVDVRLIHGSSWLADAKPVLSPAPSDSSTAESMQVGQDWFASTRRALVAAFGVGTIDQALLGVVAAKHFFVRRFALAGKVVILDEIHSYDLYTGTLVDRLVDVLHQLGCTVIILSATLTRERQAQIVGGDVGGSQGAYLPYPMISWRSDEAPAAVAPLSPPSRELQIEFSSTENATAQACEVARNGGAVLWICNTVGAAQEQYARFKRSLGQELPLGLLHSRFPHRRRERIEEEWMERLGKSGSTRCGSILVATQVVEQSVDLDADFMVTELAPTDMLLQRSGRLWRHGRVGRPVPGPRLCILSESRSLDDLRRMETKEIKEVLGKKAFVYHPYVLLRTLEVCSARQSILIPEEIRALLQATYELHPGEPASWLRLLETMREEAEKHRLKADFSSNIWNLQLDDEEGIQTRLNERPTRSLVLCSNLDGNRISFPDGRQFRLNDPAGQFSLRKALHENLVKVPQHLFERTTGPGPFGRLLLGSHAAGMLEADGQVRLDGLKTGWALYYSDTTGLRFDRVIQQGVDDGEVF